MTMAKGIANGFPMGVTMATEEVASCFEGSLTISTFGGNPVSSTAALATIETMEAEDVPGRATRLGKRLRDGLGRLLARSPEHRLRQHEDHHRGRPRRRGLR